MKRGIHDTKLCSFYDDPEQAELDDQLWTAVKGKNTDQARELIERGANVNAEPMDLAQTEAGMLSIACLNKDVGLVRLLLKSGAKLSMVLRMEMGETFENTEHLDTALHFLVHQGTPEVVQMVLETSETWGEPSTMPLLYRGLVHYAIERVLERATASWDMDPEQCDAVDITTMIFETVNREWVSTVRELTEGSCRGWVPGLTTIVLDFAVHGKHARQLVNESIGCRAPAFETVASRSDDFPCVRKLLDLYLRYGARPLKGTIDSVTARVATLEGYRERDIEQTGHDVNFYTPEIEILEDRIKYLKKVEDWNQDME